MKATCFILIVIAFTCNLTPAVCQLQDFNTQRSKTDQKLMLSLGSWASTNIVGSGIGWARSNSEENKYFHQMNVMWNLVNLGLAIPGYIKAKKDNSVTGVYQILEAQRKTETVFLVNAGIDLAYIGSGLLLRGRAPNVEKSSQFMGYGNSMILQGGFLLLFDWIAYSIHRKNAKNQLAPILQKIEPSDQGIGLKYKLD
jgi:hypothetical protein